MEETQVIITKYSVPPSNTKGLQINECDCGEHLWALPWNDSLAKWIAHQNHPLRDYIASKGFAPTFSHHVILASPEDRHLLQLRRWRSFPNRGGCRAKYQLQSGPRGLPLHRMVMTGAKIVRQKNRNGLDVRRKKMTKQQIARECRARKVANRKAQQSAVR